MGIEIWDLGLGGDWEQGIGWELGIEIEDQGLGNRIGIGNWDWGLGLRIGIRDWN